MPTAFQNALDQLDAVEIGRVQLVFTAWGVDATMAQVGENIATETAFPVDDFVGLLRTFATQLGNGGPPKHCWQVACRAHQRRGAEVPAGACPIVLGRAKNLEHHARDVGDASGGFFTSPEEARRTLLKYSGYPDPTAFDPYLKAAPLGNRHLVWATFNAADSGLDPFATLTLTLAEVRTALGLGPIDNDESLILLWWDHAASGSPPLHRPTVADAGDYPYYRPHPDPANPWGSTHPLPPNPHGLLPQPEVVLADVTCIGLRLPFRVV